MWRVPPTTRVRPAATRLRVPREQASAPCCRCWNEQRNSNRMSQPRRWRAASDLVALLRAPPAHAGRIAREVDVVDGDAELVGQRPRGLGIGHPPPGPLAGFRDE